MKSKVRLEEKKTKQDSQELCDNYACVMEIPEGEKEKNKRNI